MWSPNVPKPASSCFVVWMYPTLDLWPCNAVIPVTVWFLPPVPILGEQLASDDQAADVVDIGTVISLGDGDGIARSVYESIGWRPPYSPSCGPVASASSGHGCHSPPVFPLPAWC